MANPRVRFDEKGRIKPCIVKVPENLSVILYRAALRARQGRGGVQVDESKIVISLIEEWAKSQETGDWPSLFKELKAEEEADAQAGLPDVGTGSGLKKQPKSSENT